MPNDGRSKINRMEFSDIKGLGQKKIDALKKAGYSCPEDLLLLFPKKYIDTDFLTRIETVKTGDEVVFLGTLSGMPVRKTVRKGLFFVRAEFSLGDGGKVSCIWFNNLYIRNSLKENKPYYIVGKAKKSGSRVEISAPSLFDLSLGGGIIPIYHSVSGFSQTALRNIIGEVLDRVHIRGFLPKEIAAEFALLPLSETVRILHRPESIAQIERARKSAALEMLGCDLAVFFLHKDSGGKRVFKYEDKSSQMESLIFNALPYPLTDSQRKCIYDIIATLTGGERMNRLLQGDVGSGKTVVALCAMYFAFLNGYQSVLMAPTEILARQHFETATALFEPLGVKAALLTGSQSKSERQDKLFNIRSGLYDFIIGTHALIQNDVEFANLSLIITDEQQRFGVEQRGRLENKSIGTDCLILSATPIPRTLSLILYGELEQSLLARIEGKKARTFSRLVPVRKLDDMYAYISDKAAKGEKTYIVCPRIEEDEDDGLYSAKEVFATLKKKAAIAPHLSLLHGQMKEEEKSRIMEDFSLGNIKILVATTVIEVGIDVKDATTIVIFNPERYGLSQLHQLRGRVGRGDKDSYCFLVADESGEVSETLNFFLTCNDGFELAEYDFKSRGAGDFLGTRQHGGSKVLSYCITPDIILTAKNIAARLIASPNIKAEILSSLTGEKISYIKNLTLS